MKIEPLTINHASLFHQEYKAYFKDKNLPYANILSIDFLKNRILNSCLFSTDCSQILFTDSGQFCGIIIANLKANPSLDKSTQLVINLFFVKENIDDEAILMANILAIAKKNNCKKIVTSLQWGGIWAGVPSQLTHNIACYKKSAGKSTLGEVFLELELSKFNINSAKNLGNYQLKFYDETYFSALKKLVSDYFSVGWEYEVLSKVNSAIEPFNGYGLSTTYHPKDVMILTQHNKLCGFCIVQSQTNNEMAFFGPIGLATEHRGKGLGLALLEFSLNYLKQLGKLKLGLWTNNEIYQHFYKPLGFDKTHETFHFEWHL